MHSAQELVSQIEALTSLPTVYERVREQLESPEGSVFEVARLVSADPALTARLLRLVNSAMYGHRGEIDNVVRAVQILGLQQVHDLVLAMSLHAVFAGIRPAQLDMNRFWRDSVLCALASRSIAQHAGAVAVERSFVMGLLADIGHLVLFQTAPELAAEARTIAEQGDEPLHLIERRIVGCDFAEVGATLMDQWRVPRAFAEAIGA
ncbi:MAG: HDOD domain-containing protein, partial [Candidatus Cloacimonetes bacterium]|nr:HDOD domain-containing protein [Candidatus Cloacimonadota bacterium]